MRRTPRTLAVTIDTRELLAALDKVLIGLSGAGTINAEIRNSATTKRDNKLLFPFLDKGTAPHWIGGEDEILADKAKGFGPFYGPVFHPGSRPHDISPRVTAYFQARLDQLVNGPAATSLVNQPLEQVLYTRVFQTVRSALADTVLFAQRITPANWRSVREAYEAYVNNRKISSS